MVGCAHRFRYSWALIFAGLYCLLPAFIQAQDEFSLSQETLIRVEKKHGKNAIDRLREWQRLINDKRKMSDKEKLKLVNDFFNQLDFVDDIIHWGKQDYWATPIEFLSTNAGDCEDFSVAKYFTLKALGLSVDNIYLTYVKSVRLNQSHMVVTYYPSPNAEPLVLDNLDGAIRAASQRKDLVPVFSFNGDGLWLAKQRGKGKHVGKPGRLARWKELVARLRSDNVQVNH